MFRLIILILTPSINIRISIQCSRSCSHTHNSCLIGQLYRFPFSFGSILLFTMSDHEFDSDCSAEDFFEKESDSEEEYEEGDDLGMKEENEVDCKKTLYDNEWSSKPPPMPFADGFSFDPDKNPSTNSTTPMNAFFSIISTEILEK